MQEPRPGAPVAAAPAASESPPPGGPPSERVRLARSALIGATRVGGVAEGHPGASGVGVTYGGGERLVGVAAAVLPDGRYEVTLHLVADLVPLHPLADEVRSGVARRAAEDGLAERLGPVNVSFEDLAQPARS